MKPTIKESIESSKKLLASGDRILDRYDFLLKSSKGKTLAEMTNDELNAIDRFQNKNRVFISED
jgi:hypothetical protein